MNQSDELLIVNYGLLLRRSSIFLLMNGLFHESFELLHIVVNLFDINLKLLAQQLWFFTSHILLQHKKVFLKALQLSFILYLDPLVSDLSMLINCTKLVLHPFLLELLIILNMSGFNWRYVHHFLISQYCPLLAHCCVALELLLGMRERLNFHHDPLLCLTVK